MSNAIEQALDRVTWTPCEPPETSGDLPYITHAGVLHLGSVSLRVYQLSNGKRIIDAEDMATFAWIEEGAYQ